MTIKSILVTGAAGMVGSYVPDVFNNNDLILTDIVGDYKYLDIRDPKAVMQTIQEVTPQVVLHLAAETDVDLCEKQPDKAYITNTIGTQNVALACQETGSLLIYISTAAVFSGDKPEPYTEFDLPDATNVYGDSKWQGEKIVTSLLNRFFICRTGWMMGGGKKDKKFVGKITRLMLEGSNPLKVVGDKIGSPIYAKDLLFGIRRLLETRFYGLYHIANKGIVSRYEIALAIRDAIRKTDVVIERVNSAYHPLPAPRPSYEAVRNYKLDLLGMNEMRSWRDSLKEYVVTELVPSLS